jgi:uncharacterized coiled-coil protein SlyX
MVAMPIFFNQYMEMIKATLANQAGHFNRHENWARLLADKLKQIEPRKAEHMKVQIDTWVLQFLPENFE